MKASTTRKSNEKKALEEIRTAPKSSTRYSVTTGPSVPLHDGSPSPWGCWAYRGGLRRIGLELRGGEQYMLLSPPLAPVPEDDDDPRRGELSPTAVVRSMDGRRWFHTLTCACPWDFESPSSKDLEWCLCPCLMAADPVPGTSPSSRIQDPAIARPIPL
jgi:hypothetical protein